MTKILRLPGNTLGSQELLNLAHVNGPRFASASALCGAAAIRAATGTISVWPAALSAIIQAAQAALPFASVVRGSLSQAFWDEPPFALFLFSASCFSCLLPPPPVLPASSAPFPPLPSSSLPPPPFPFPSLSLPFRTPVIPPAIPQRHAYSVLIGDWSPQRWTAFLTSRLRGAHGLNVQSLSRVNFEHSFQFLRRCSPHIAMCWLKTIANGWTTSFRLHAEHGGKCIFCHRAGADRLQHYLYCDVFDRIVSGVTAEDACTWEEFFADLESARPASIDPLKALALVPSDHCTMKTVFVKFTVYHTCHNLYSSSSSSFSQHSWRAVLVNTARTAAAKFEALRASFH